MKSEFLAAFVGGESLLLAEAIMFPLVADELQLLGVRAEGTWYVYGFLLITEDGEELLRLVRREVAESRVLELLRGSPAKAHGVFWGKPVGYFGPTQDESLQEEFGPRISLEPDALRAVGFLKVNLRRSMVHETLLVSPTEAGAVLREFRGASFSDEGNSTLEIKVDHDAYELPFARLVITGDRYQQL